MKAVFFGIVFLSFLAWCIITPLWEIMDGQGWSNEKVGLTIAGILSSLYLIAAGAFCATWRRCGREKEERSVLIDQDPAREVFLLRVYKDVG